MEGLAYLTGFILVAGIATFVTRALPFWIFRKQEQHPLLQYLGRYLPPVMMVLLLIYASGDLPRSWGSLIALILVALVQWYGRNALLSIFLGTLAYILLS